MLWCLILQSFDVLFGYHFAHYWDGLLPFCQLVNCTHLRSWLTDTFVNEQVHFLKRSTWARNVGFCRASAQTSLQRGALQQLTPRGHPLSFFRGSRHAEGAWGSLSTLLFLLLRLSALLSLFCLIMFRVFPYMAVFQKDPCWPCPNSKHFIWNKQAKLSCMS